jgi:hypothetical protein
MLAQTARVAAAFNPDVPAAPACILLQASGFTNIFIDISISY